jgi:glycosyltransferase involved in cell wall biosynthesis
MSPDVAPTLCFVIACMGRLSHLKETLASAVSQPGCSCVVVDYSCPDHCGDWVEANFPQVRVVRVEGKSTYSQSIARNAGARAVEADWICFRDADVVLAPSFAEQVMPLLRPGGYYLGDPLDDVALCGTFVCARSDFVRIGGYDEVYEGWGDEDLDVYDALENFGVERRPFASSLLRHLAHDDATRTRFHEVKETARSRTINMIYRCAKFDLMRVMRKEMPLEERQALYRVIAGTVKSVKPEEKRRTIAINLGGLSLVLPRNGELARTLVYTYHIGE